MLRRATSSSPSAQEASTTTASGESSPQGEPTSDKPWYLDGENETWGWENTNAQDAEEEDG